MLFEFLNSFSLFQVEQHAIQYTNLRDRCHATASGSSIKRDREKFIVNSFMAII